jgi:hypothetical protein
MKPTKTLFLLLALLFAIPAMHSQNAELGSNSKGVNELFREFSKEKGVVRVNIGRFPMMFVRLFTEAKGVRGVEVLDFSDSSSAVKERLNRDIRSLKDVDYEKLMSVNDGGDRVDIWIKMRNDTIRELIVMVTGDDHALIRIKGRIKFSDIESIVNDTGKMNRR